MRSYTARRYDYNSKEYSNYNPNPNPNPVNNNSPIQDYVHPDDQTQPTFEMTPGFKPFTVIIMFFLLSLGIV